MGGIDHVWLAPPDLTAMNAALAAASASTTTLAARVAALESPAVGTLSGTTGQGTLGANIGIAATFDITVPLAATMPNATYGAYFSIEGAAGLLGVFVGQIKSKTTTSVVVSLKNTGLVSIGSGAIVRVVAIN